MDMGNDKPPVVSPSNSRLICLSSDIDMIPDTNFLPKFAPCLSVIGNSFNKRAFESLGRSPLSAKMLTSVFLFFSFPSCFR